MNSCTLEEIEIIKNAKAGSIKAFNSLFQKYKTFVDNLLYTYVKDMDEAKDLTNVVFLKIYEKLNKFTDYNTFQGWIRTVAKNVAIDYLRTMKHKETDFTENIKSKECDTENKITYESMIKNFNSLSEKQKLICTLFYINNLSIKEIKRITSMPEGTIKSHLHRSRKLLKKLC